MLQAFLDGKRLQTVRLFVRRRRRLPPLLARIAYPLVRVEQASHISRPDLLRECLDAVQTLVMGDLDDQEENRRARTSIEVTFKVA